MRCNDASAGPIPLDSHASRLRRREADETNMETYGSATFFQSVRIVLKPLQSDSSPIFNRPFLMGPVVRCTCETIVIPALSSNCIDQFKGCPPADSSLGQSCSLASVVASMKMTYDPTKSLNGDHGQDRQRRTDIDGTCNGMY